MSIKSPPPNTLYNLCNHNEQSDTSRQKRKRSLLERFNFAKQERGYYDAVKIFDHGSRTQTSCLTSRTAQPLRITAALLFRSTHCENIYMAPKIGTVIHGTTGWLTKFEQIRSQKSEGQLGEQVFYARVNKDGNDATMPCKDHRNMLKS